uniref:Uncharacterized protein n=1 Tax=Triticum urartu TaxID=4572 RepID=A0A8R7P700_TRIUA
GQPSLLTRRETCHRSGASSRTRVAAAAPPAAKAAASNPLNPTLAAMVYRYICMYSVWYFWLIMEGGLAVHGCPYSIS